MKFESIELNFNSVDSNMIFVAKDNYGIHVKNMYCIQICAQILYLFLDLTPIHILTQLVNLCWDMSQDLTATNIAHFSRCRYVYYMV
jgi:hypothetical protein